jgi:LPXTG-site transpeptidase (sortase) family protein
VLLADAAVLAGVLLATSPWTTGAYTWLAQRRLAAAVAPLSPRSAEATLPARPRAKGRDPVWQDWEREEQARWRGAAEGDALARLAIPKLGLDIAVVKGVADADLREGPGWMTWTAVPGAGGNVGISGHRTTYLAPFRHLDRLAPGDAVTLVTPTRRYTYRVKVNFVVAPDDTDVMFDTAKPTLTLTACHPPYSDRFRIVVQAELVRAERLAR